MMRKEAVVLLNMGGPNNLQEVELFLKNMFSDPNILTMKSALLRKFVGTMITFMRTEHSQEIYEQIGGKSPIVGHTKALVQRLQAKAGEGVIVDFAMRYTPPFADEVIERLNEADVDGIYLIPLYAQYSTTTTKSSLEDFYERYAKMGKGALLYEIKHFFEHPLFNRAVVEDIKSTLGDSHAGEFHLIFSAHGLPQKIVDRGDVYQEHITRHVKILSELLACENIGFRSIELAYQSKVGPMKWLEPSLDTKLRELEGKKVIIYPIAFTIDNSETDYELHMEYKEVADEMGFEDYRVVKCLNESELFVDALYDIYTKMKMV